MSRSFLVSSVVSVFSCVFMLTLATEAAAQASCPRACLAWADAQIPEGDELRIVHNGDQEAIAVSFEGVVVALLAFKNTSPSVQLYQACHTSESTKIDDLLAAEFAACRYDYTETADALGIPVSIE